MNTIDNNPSRLVSHMAPRIHNLVLLSALAVFAGCESEPESHVVSSPPPPAPNVVGTQPVIVTTQSTTTTGPVTTTQTVPASTVYVTQAPPAAQAEVIVAQPSPEYVWIAGYWTWRHERYEWMAGHWEVPPHSNAVWIPPHYEPENSGFRFYEGYWN
jgi:hypothetical protein